MKTGDLVRTRQNTQTFTDHRQVDSFGIIVEVHHPSVCHSSYRDYRTPTSVLVLFPGEGQLKNTVWYHKSELVMICEMRLIG
jgi:hypothetical protein